MSEPTGPHDIGGEAAGPVDLSERDTAYWEWQIDAMIRLALDKGLLTDFAELRDGIEKLTPDDYESAVPITNAGRSRWPHALLSSAASITEDALDRAGRCRVKHDQASGRADET